MGRDSCRHGLNFLIPCVGLPNLVGPKDVGVVGALSGPAGCGGVESTCHVSLICSRKVAWGSGNKVNTRFASNADFGML